MVKMLLCLNTHLSRKQKLKDSYTYIILVHLHKIEVSVVSRFGHLNIKGKSSRNLRQLTDVARSNRQSWLDGEDENPWSRKEQNPDTPDSIESL
jgi:hypothetical protein